MDCLLCGEELCSKGRCHDCQACDYHAEKAFEAQLEDFYGASTPQTDQERYQAAAEEKRRIG